MTKKKAVKTQQLNIKIEAGLKDKLRHKAKQSGTTMRSIVEDGICLALYANSNNSWWRKWI